MLPMRDEQGKIELLSLWTPGRLSLAIDFVLWMKYDDFDCYQTPRIFNSCILLQVGDNNVTDSLMELTSLPFIEEDGHVSVEAGPAPHGLFHLDYWSRWSRGW